MRRTALVAALLTASAGLSGCDNPCQALCVKMADFRAECGTAATDAEVATCVEDFDAVTPDESRACRDFGSAEVLRREWTCDDVNLWRSVDDAAGG